MRGTRELGMSNQDLRYNSPELAQLGWNEGRVRTVTPSDATASYTLTPLETDAPGTAQALRLVDGSTTLWVEFHNYFGPNSVNGFLFVLREEAGPDGTPLEGSPFILDMGHLPSDGSNGRTEWMPLGQTWSNPLGSMSITLNSAPISGANVTIGTPTPGPGPGPAPGPTPPPPPPPPADSIVPNLIGDQTQDAGDEIRAAALVVGTTRTHVDTDCVDLFTVISQSPSAGTHVPPGSSVDFTYSIPPKNGCGTPS
jgi:hypothetical protein